VNEKNAEVLLFSCVNRFLWMSLY